MADNKKSAKAEKEKNIDNENIVEENEKEAGQNTETCEETQKEAETEEAAKQDEGDASEDGKSSLFKKKNKKDKKDEQIDELNDKYKRLFAEFDNFRRRSEAEKASNYEFGAKEVILKILPVVDNFERGLATIPEDEKGKPFAEGMEMIYKQLMTSLEDMGVKPIECVGQEFDPELHNAVMQSENPDFGENIVSQELQKGYTYKDKAIRHSMVAVNK